MSTVTKKEARHTLIKFLKENNCFKEYIACYVGYRNTFSIHNGNFSMSPSDIIDSTIDSAVSGEYSLGRIFGFTHCTFFWMSPEVINVMRSFYVTNSCAFWKRISDKFLKKYENVYISK